jgi:hypothetical protein
MSQFLFLEILDNIPDVCFLLIMLDKADFHLVGHFVKKNLVNNFIRRISESWEWSDDCSIGLKSIQCCCMNSSCSSSVTRHIIVYPKKICTLVVSGWKKVFSGKCTLIYGLVHHDNPCGGGVEYLHRDPASRKRRRNGAKKGRAIA